MANLAQENKDLRERLAELERRLQEQPAAPEDLRRQLEEREADARRLEEEKLRLEQEREQILESANRLAERALEADEVGDLRRKLAEKDAALLRLSQEKAHLTGDIGDAPEGKTRYFATVSNFRLTFPFRKPVAKLQPNGSTFWEPQEANTAVFQPLASPWAGSIYDTDDPDEIAYLEKLKGINQYLFKRGDDNCPRPERIPKKAPVGVATAEVR
jgi:hypothetical protein